MQIFISWSGERARLAAKALRDWLKCVIQSAQPWMSEEDLGPGTRWSIELAKKLEETNFGIVCLTRESLNSSWILFESGALAKALSQSRVCPFLIGGLEPRDLPAPLGQFNAVAANETGTFQLLKSVNRALEENGEKPLMLEEEILRRTFEKWWPELEEKLKELPKADDQSTFVATGNNMGIEYVYEKRSTALERFSEFLENEIEKVTGDEEEAYFEEPYIYVVGTSMRAFLVHSEQNYDGLDILRKAIERKCRLRFMLTSPEIGDFRHKQERRDQGDISNEIKQSVRDLRNAGVSRENIRYYSGSPTVFGIATTERMLLNPYPYEQEAHRCFTIIVRKTENPRDIYHQYIQHHFEKPWQQAILIPDSDWETSKTGEIKIPDGVRKNEPPQ